MRLVVIKNNTNDTHTWCNKEYAPGEENVLSTQGQANNYLGNTAFIIAVASGQAQIGNGNIFMPSLAEAIAWLGGDIVEVNSTPPFATPTYRTKYDATPSSTIVPVNNYAHIDFLLTDERYVSGGCLMVKNGQFGDYVVAEVRDEDGVIPEEYRSTLCESWPTVAKYIVKGWIKYCGGDYTAHEIDTVPLNAKITAGLYLRLTYYTTSAGTDREVLINYYFTKKT